MTIIKKLTISILLIVFIAGCGDLLNKNPLTQISTKTFWKTPKDAMLALTGVYSKAGNNWWSFGSSAMMDAESDDGYSKEVDGYDLSSNTLNPSDGTIAGKWSACYRMIAAANNFLEHIDKVHMSEEEKAEMKAEVKFIRAYEYFWMSQFWGAVPLVTKTLTAKQADNVSRTPKDSVTSFVLKQLTEAANNLPLTRPDKQNGRITRGAALAIKGRLLMAQKKWSAAAKVYKKIINSGLYTIDPNYKSLFVEGNEFSKEIILSTQYLQGQQGSPMQQNVLPRQYGGYATYSTNQNLVNAYLMKDGLPKSESPLYDPKHSLKNRDPRLYQTVFLPGMTKFRGRIFRSNPDSADNGDVVGHQKSNGYGGILKWADEDYTGNNFQYGGNVPLIRYAEVLLSYLESKLEAGDEITQHLLNQTINKVRKRPSTDMPPVTVTNTDSLRIILRRERRVELAFEGLRLWDLKRWGTARKRMTRNFYGIKLTNDPANYHGFTVNNKGHYFNFKNVFAKKNLLWPIPQSEIDIDPNLTQNPGY